MMKTDTLDGALTLRLGSTPQTPIPYTQSPTPNSRRRRRLLLGIRDLRNGVSGRGNRESGTTPEPPTPNSQFPIPDSRGRRRLPYLLRNLRHGGSGIWNSVRWVLCCALLSLLVGACGDPETNDHRGYTKAPLEHPSVVIRGEAPSDISRYG